MIHEYSGLNINPCPFCKYDGAATAVVVDHIHGQENRMVECGGCGAIGPASDCYEMGLGVDSPEEQAAIKAAIEKWNAASN